jgi:uncharacterized protein (TIGR02453 family)
MAKVKFDGFSPKLLKFLHELTNNNNREWFQENKERYERDVREPAMQFIESMQDPLKRISPHFNAIAKKVGGSLLRVNRDIRFSKDKRPYKTNVGIHFNHNEGKDIHAPGFYFHIDVDQVFLAVGIWHPDNPTLEKIRRQIDENPAQWKKARDNKSFRQQFRLSGESLVRPPKGFDADHPMIDDLKRKDHVADCEMPHTFITSSTVVKDVGAIFRKSKPYMAFLCRSVGLEF